jgi:hypothetical protein
MSFYKITNVLSIGENEVKHPPKSLRQNDAKGNGRFAAAGKKKLTKKRGRSAGSDSGDLT